MVRQLLGDVEEYVAKEEEHGAQEGWTEVIRWGTETVFANDAAICIECSTLYLQFIEVLDPHIHSHLSQTRQTLPMKFHLPLWGLIQRVLGHQNSDGWSLEMPGEIHAFLQTWAVKKFLSGLTVYVHPPLHIKFDQAKDCVKISFNCEVYNAWGTLQWLL